MPISTQLLTFKSILEGHRLTPVQRRIAQTLAAHLARADYLTTSELAELAGVSQPSVVRFATALGYSGYAELRRALRDLGSGERHQQDPGALNKYQLAISEEIANLSRLSALLADGSQLERIGSILAASKPLVIVGVRASQALARYAAFYARKVHPYVLVVEEAGSSAVDQLHEARQAGASAMLAVAMPRWPRDLIPLLETGRRLGYCMVGLTDQSGSPTLDYMDYSLLVPVGMTLLYDTHAAALLALSLLVEATADADPSAAEVLMEAFESRASTYQYFLKS